MAATAPTGEIWLGTIAKFTFFSVMYMCAKFGAFTTKFSHMWSLSGWATYNTHGMLQRMNKDDKR